MPLTPAERAKRSRYPARLERCLEKLATLLDEFPEGFDEDTLNIDLTVDLDLTLDLYLYRAISLLVGSEPEFELTDDHVVVCFPVPVPRSFVAKVRQESIDSDKTVGRRAYEAWIKSELSRREYARRVSKDAFCRTYLGASMASSRWGWVGVKEGKEGEPGRLYIFAWEHERKFSRFGLAPIRLFPSTLDHDSRARTHPGHRDALKNIGRVHAGELVPYLVWQRAVDKDARPLQLRGIGTQLVSRCTLRVDDDGFWIATVREAECFPTANEMSEK